MKHRPLFAALLLTVCACLWWSTRDEAAPAPSPTSPTLAAPATTPQPKDAVTSPLVAQPPATLRESPAAAAGLTVRVVDPAQRPVAGAAIEVGGDDPIFRLPLTDADGCARADRLPGGNVWLRVRHDGSTGTASWRWAPPLAHETTIRLMRDRVVEVTVTDGSGSPRADIDVTLQAGNAPSAFSQKMHRTAADGTARISIPGPDWLALQPGVSARAVAAGGHERAETEVVPYAADGPTRLRLALARSPEPTGGITVRFVDTNGTPASARGRLTWSITIHANTGGPFPARFGDVEVDGASALVTSVREGDEVSLVLYEPDRLEARHRVLVPVSGGRPETMITRGAPSPQLEVPLVDAKGAPVTSGEFVLFARHDNGNTSAEKKVTPDAQGIVRLALSTTTPGQLEIARPFAVDELHGTVPEGLPRPYNTTIGRLPPPPPCLAVSPFPALQHSPVHRIEAVVVPALAATITGRVVDRDGKPAAGVRIGLTSVTAPEPAAFASFATRSDATGRFTIRATTLPDEVFVFARCPGGFTPPLRTRSANGPAIELTLQPTGTLAMALRHAPGLGDGARRANEPASVALVLDEAALTDGAWALFRDRAWIGQGHLLSRWHVLRYLHQDGEFVFDDLVPASYEVRALMGTTPLFSVRDVVVRAGETTRPPQLDGLVLGDGVEAVSVRVLGRDGKPLPGAWVRFRLPEWKETLPSGTNQETDAQGEAWFLVPRNAVTDVEVVAAGLAPLRQRSVRFPLEVRLGDGATVTIALRGHELLREAVRALVVVCRPHENGPPDSPVRPLGDLVQLHHPQATVGNDGRAAIPNLAPGRWRVWLVALPRLDAPRGTSIPFVLLGDHDVTSVDATRIDLPHELTAAELTMLRGN